MIIAFFAISSSLFQRIFSILTVSVEIVSIRCMLRRRSSCGCVFIYSTRISYALGDHWNPEQCSFACLYLPPRMKFTEEKRHGQMNKHAWCCTAIEPSSTMINTISNELNIQASVGLPGNNCHHVKYVYKERLPPSPRMYARL